MMSEREAVRQWVRDHAYRPDDIVLGDGTMNNDGWLRDLHKLLDAADPEWRKYCAFPER